MIFGGPGFAGGFITGFISGFASRELVGLAIKYGKPIITSMKKYGEEIFEMSKENLAHMGESLEDFVAEVRSDMTKKPETADVVTEEGSEPVMKAKKQVP